MSSYKPRVKCSQRPAPPWKSTVSIFADMDATKDLAIFGRAGASGVDITLPLNVKASMSVLHDFTIHVYLVGANLGP